MLYTSADQLMQDLEIAHAAGRTCSVRVRPPKGKGFTIQTILRIAELGLVQSTHDVGPLGPDQATLETVIAVRPNNFSVEQIKKGFHDWIQAVLQIGSTVEIK